MKVGEYNRIAAAADRTVNAFVNGATSYRVATRVWKNILLTNKDKFCHPKTAEHHQMQAKSLGAGDYEVTLKGGQNETAN